MNILVVNPPNKPFTNRSILAEPLDVLEIATVIRQEFSNVKVIDMDIERMDNDINGFLSSKNIVVLVYDYQLPLHTSNTVYNIFEIIRNCKKDTKFIIVGKSSSYYYKQFMDNGVDVVISGIAEHIINRVIASIYDSKRLQNIPNIIYKNGNSIIKNKICNIENRFNELPFPNRDFVNIDKYMDTRTMITSRGCVGKCKFCTTPYYFKKWCGKSAEDVVLEIEMLVEKYNAKKIIFLDDNATVNKNRMMQICKLLKEKQIKCLYGVLCSIECYNQEMIEEMYSVGFRWIHFGLESGSLKILKEMNKEMDIESVKKIINDVKKVGYRVRTSFILDYPKTTKEDIKMTKDLILDIEPHEIRLHYLAYRVGTPVFYENKDIQNKSQYIHNNKPNVENTELNQEIDELLRELQNRKYNLVTNDIDWNKFNNGSKETRIVAFTPIKYGMCWYE